MSEDRAPKTHFYVALLGDEVSYTGKISSQVGPDLMKASGHIEVSQEDHDRVAAGGRWRMVDGTLTPILPEPESLAAAIARATRLVDGRAEQLRAAQLTPGSTMTMVYAAKEREARAALAGYPAEMPDAAQCPLLYAEVGVTGATVIDVARIVLDRATNAHAYTGKVEATRLRAKAALRTATTPEAVAALLSDLEWPAAPG